MTNPPTLTLAQAIGRVVKRRRNRLGASQDELAAAARLAGLDWTQGSVASLETGRRDLSVHEVALLPEALAALEGPGTAYSLADLVEGLDEPVWVGRVSVDAKVVRATLAGRALSTLRGAAAVELLRRVDVEHMAQREAERHAARRLGVDAETVAETSIKVWGRGLTEERDRRLGDRGDESLRSLQAIRGHITRQLLKVLREAIKEAGS